MKSEILRDEEKQKDEASETTALFATRSAAAPIFPSSFLWRLERTFGWRLLFLLWVVQHMMKGLSHSMISKALPYLFRAYSLDAPTVQVMNGLIFLPWAVKPMIGFLSDTVPIFGFRKAPYMLGSTFVSILAFSFLITGSPTAMVAVLCVMLIMLQYSSCDILSEARYAASIQEAPQAGPDLLSYVWAGINIFTCLTMLCSGPLLESYGFRGALIFGLLPSALVVLPIGMGALQERRISQEELVAIRRRYFEQREMCFVCLMMFVGAVVIMFVGLLQHDPRVNFGVSLAVCLLILACSSVCLTPLVAKANAFGVLYTGFNASVSGASFYFYTDSKEVYPAGPHFSDFFYNTVLGTIGCLMALLGIWFYQQFLSSMSYRKLVLVTSLMMFSFSLLDVMMFARLNVRWGIPDHWLVAGLSIFEVIIAQWQWMPQVVLLAALCPKGMEATMLALLAGCHNLGGTLSANLGAMLLYLLGVKPQGGAADAAQFENLWLAAAVSSCLLLATALLLRYLLPDCMQTEKICVGDPTKNSLLRRWLNATPEAF